MPWSPATTQVVSKLTKSGALWEYSSYVYGQFQAKRCLGCRMFLQALWAGLEEQDSHPAPTQLRPMLTSASCQAIQVLWTSGGGAELKGWSHCDGHVVFRMDTYFLTKPQSCLVWFCGFLPTHSRKSGLALWPLHKRKDYDDNMNKTVIRKQLFTGEDHPAAICPAPHYLRMCGKADTDGWVLAVKLPEAREPLTSSISYFT